MNFSHKCIRPYFKGKLLTSLNKALDFTGSFKWNDFLIQNTYLFALLTYKRAPNLYTIVFIPPFLDFFFYNFSILLFVTVLCVYFILYYIFYIFFCQFLVLIPNVS